MRTNHLSKLISLFVITLGINTLQAQLSLVNTTGDASVFSIVNKNNTATIYYDASDFEVVKMASKLLAEDIERVTAKLPVVSSNKPKAKNAIIIGTLGKSKLINQLIKSGKVNSTELEGNWERYLYKTVKNPLPNVDNALVIIGSDRRGTAYGVFDLSKTIGVSPWYWWADVPTVKRKELSIADIDFISKAPSVKYRGVFINDEDWGLKPWASKLMDPQINDIGPNTYEKVCELLLRLKANMLAPAMHEVTGAFYKYPENKMVADKFAIMMTSSHAEPLLYNNTTEWDKKIDGAWDYVRNKKGVLAALDKRVKEAAPFENIYTVGMRGIHDTGMKDVPEGYTKANVLEQVIDAERDILTKYIKKSKEEIPQIFVPYKEVLDIYESGMKLPDDVTIVWPDDNFGYIKKLSDNEEAKRKGGAGVYYHISYLGEPNDYLWLNTTPPALIYEEMFKAYQNGADRYWLLNVGDIKPGELGMQFFLDLAWDIDMVTYNTVPDYNSSFLASIFGNKYKEDFKDIYNSYFHLGFERKPEYMGWDWRWNSIDAKERIIDTEFSFTNYNEAQNRIDEYDRIASKAEKLLKELPDQYKSSFYHLLYYPVVGSSLVSKKMLAAQKNRWYAQQGRAATNGLIDDVKAYDARLTEITAHYNGLENGKWTGIMTAPERLPEIQLPETEKIDLPENSEMGVFIPSGSSINTINVLPRFNKFTKQSHSIEVFNKGKNDLKWSAKTDNSWILLSKNKGKTSTQETVNVTVDWSKAPVGTNIKGEIHINAGDQIEKVHLSLHNPATSAEELNVLYVEDNGVVSISPSEFSRKYEKNGMKIQVIEELGYEGNSVQLGTIVDKGWRNASVEYDFYSETAGWVTVHTYALPLFGKDEKNGTTYGVQIDNSMVSWETTASPEYSFDWKKNVIRNSTINTSKILIDKPGKHTLKLISGNPGMVIQKVVVDFGGMKNSYLGPKPTLVNPKTK
ncbi:glycosyl hydrolase 115 family protein [Mariniflexile litorale]|uniref:Glycosyl hydrolase 115 family protein n=1 Tax=Mariniflexile litorale TaxID=3045158 RepID=A0AAU7EEV8_9FLAO|nr:glycosyl hydrolase 115 family protein [Mariniflexile sp. KMM 9835]MDQ8210865.1 glycosyl hydrolase 115 family protein [Mariniflexile sp. KMM 9835]